jgi:hypothetical protein
MKIGQAEAGELVTKESHVTRWELEVWTDEYADSPREMYDNLGTFLTWDRGYDSPDKNAFDSPQDFYDWWMGYGPCIYCGDALHPDKGVMVDETGGDVCSGDWDRTNEYESHVSRTDNPPVGEGGVLLDVFKFEHSGVAYKAVAHGSGDPFGSYYMGMDSGQVGFIFVTEHDIVGNWGVTGDHRDDAARVLAGDVDEYSTWASGGVWGFTITDNREDTRESCGGYIEDLTEKSLKSAIRDFADVPDDVLDELVREAL